MEKTNIRKLRVILRDMEGGGEPNGCELHASDGLRDQIYRTKFWLVLVLLLDWGIYRRKSGIPLDLTLLIHTL